MSNDIFLRGGCEHCAGHLEFPGGAAGGTAPCPHCGQITRLVAFAAPGPAGRGKLWLWIGVGALAIIVGAAGGAALFLVQKGHGASSAPATPVPQTNIVATTAPKQPRTDDVVTNDFSIEDIKLEKQAGSSLVYITGQARNLAARQRFGVTVEFTLFDTNDQPIGKAKDYEGIMDPQGQWSFKAMVLESKTTYARFLDVSESQ